MEGFWLPNGAIWGHLGIVFCDLGMQFRRIHALVFDWFGEKEGHAHAHIWTDLVRILGMVAVYGGVPSDGLGDIQGAE